MEFNFLEVAGPVQQPVGVAEQSMGSAGESTFAQELSEAGQSLGKGGAVRSAEEEPPEGGDPEPDHMEQAGLEAGSVETVADQEGHGREHLLRDAQIGEHPSSTVVEDPWGELRKLQTVDSERLYLAGNEQQKTLQHGSVSRLHGADGTGQSKVPAGDGPVQHAVSLEAVSKEGSLIPDTRSFSGSEVPEDGSLHKDTRTGRSLEPLIAGRDPAQSVHTDPGEVPEKNALPDREIVKESGVPRVEQGIGRAARLLSLEENLARFADQEQRLIDRLQSLSVSRVSDERFALPAEKAFDAAKVSPESYNPARSLSLEENLARFVDRKQGEAKVMQRASDRTFAEKVEVGLQPRPERSDSVPKGFLEEKSFMGPEGNVSNTLPAGENDPARHRGLKEMLLEKTSGDLAEAQGKIIPGLDKEQVRVERSHPFHDLFSHAGKEATPFPAEGIKGGPVLEGTAQGTARPATYSGFVMDPSKAQAVMDQVLSKLRVMTTRGKEKVVLQLHPESLGRLKMHITVSDHRVVAEIMTETHVARDLVSSQIHTLKETLMDQGLRLEKFSVHLQQDGTENGFGHSGQAFRDSLHQEGGGLAQERFEDREEPAFNPLTSHVSVSDGRINVFA